MLHFVFIVFVALLYFVHRNHLIELYSCILNPSLWVEYNRTCWCVFTSPCCDITVLANVAFFKKLFIYCSFTCCRATSKYHYTNSRQWSGNSCWLILVLGIISYSNWFNGWTEAITRDTRLYRLESGSLKKGFLSFHHEWIDRLLKLFAIIEVQVYFEEANYNVKYRIGQQFQNFKQAQCVRLYEIWQFLFRRNTDKYCSSKHQFNRYLRF